MSKKRNCVVPNCGSENKQIGLCLEFRKIAHQITSLDHIMEGKAPDGPNLLKPECTCRGLTVPVLYVNIRSMNPTNTTEEMGRKITKIKNLISKHNPYLIAIVESWLTNMHSDEQILSSLGLYGYDLFRQNRCDKVRPDNAYEYSESENLARRGGGILMACKQDPVRVNRNSAEDYEDNVVNFDLFYKFNCKKCCGDQLERKYGFTIVYRRPSPFRKQRKAVFDDVDQTVTDRLIHLPAMYNDDLTDYSGWAMVGDFNWNQASKLDSITYLGGERIPLSSNSTHQSGAALDGVFASPGFVVDSMGAPLVYVTDLVSDHAALVFSLKFGKDCKIQEPCKAKNCH